MAKKMVDKSYNPFVPILDSIFLILLEMLSSLHKSPATNLKTIHQTILIQGRKMN